jgi:hypothetical protein
MSDSQYVTRKFGSFDVLLLLIFALYGYSFWELSSWLTDMKSTPMEAMVMTAWILAGSGAFVAAYELLRWLKYRGSELRLTNFSKALGYIGAGGSCLAFFFLSIWYYLDFLGTPFRVLSGVFHLIGFVHLMLWVPRGR